MKMPSECARCGAVLAEDARFCASCGARTGGGGSLAPVRKHVCVLFVDIVGSTGLAEATDPEVLRGLLARYFDTASRAIWQFGGTVEKFIGDAVMAVFGVPASREDDALRAVRAAMRIIDDVAELDWTDASGKRLEIRIGVNAGEVFVSQQPDGQFSVTGDAVNVAARLQAYAQPGEVCVGQSVADLVSGHVDLEYLGETVHRGKSTAEGHYRLTNRTAASVGLHTTTFVGRELEMADLAAVAGRVIERRQGWFVTLVGDAGQGKSRLLHELLLQQPDALVLTGSAQPTSTGAGSFAILDEVLATASPDWPGYVRRLLGAEAEPVLARLESAVGRGDAQTGLDDVAWALGRVVSRIAAERTVIMVWDDLHWASDLQLDLIQMLTEEVRRSATLTLCLTRPELFNQRPWWGGGPRSRVETVEVLPQDALKAIAEEWRRANGGAASRIQTAIRRSDGNPMVLRMLLESKADQALPMSVHALFEAALDRLTPNERAFCEAGAVLGRTFDRDAAGSVMDAPAGLDLDTLVRRLTALHVLEPIAVPGTTGNRFGFSQSLLMQKAYLSVPKQIRARRHVRAAEWLAAHADEPGSADLSVSAHLYQALDNLRAIHGDADEIAALQEKSIAAGLSALRRQVRRGDPAVVGTGRRLTAIIPGGDRRLIDVVLTLWLSRRERDGQQAFDECFAAADAALADYPWWTAVRRIPEWMNELGTGQLSAEGRRTGAVDLVSELRAAPDTPGAALLFAYFYATQVCAEVDGPVCCMEYLTQGAEIARAAQHPGAERVFMSGALQSSLASNDALDATIALAERMRGDLRGVRRALPMVHGILAAAYALSGRITAAHEAWDDVAEPRDALAAATRPFIEQYFCDVLVSAGKLDEAARRYAELAAAVSAVPTAYVDLESFAARLFLYTGDIEQARDHLAAARARTTRTGSPHHLARRLDTLDAALAALGGHADDARSFLDAATANDAAVGWLERGYLAVDAAIGHAAVDDAARATALRDESVRTFTANGAAAVVPQVDAWVRAATQAVRADGAMT
jgi:class 3 adenylate cyclase